MGTVTATVVDKSAHTATATAPYTIGSVKPLMGGTGIDNTEFNALNTAAGPLQCRRTYDGTTLPASFSASKAAPDIGTGRWSLWSYKPTVTGFATNTTAQNALRAFLQSVPAGHK